MDQPIRHFGVELETHQVIMMQTSLGVDRVSFLRKPKTEFNQTKQGVELRFAVPVVRYCQGLLKIRFPIKVRNFKVFLNGHLMTDKSDSGAINKVRFIGGELENLVGHEVAFTCTLDNSDSEIPDFEFYDDVCRNANIGVPVLTLVDYGNNPIRKERSEPNLEAAKKLRERLEGAENDVMVSLKDTTYF